MLNNPFILGHSALLQHIQALQEIKYSSELYQHFVQNHFNVKCCTAMLVSTGSQSFRDLNMICAVTQSCILSHQGEGQKCHALKGILLQSCFLPLYSKKKKKNLSTLKKKIWLLAGWHTFVLHSVFYVRNYQYKIK